MTTVAQMIEYLKTLPQDAEVLCGVEEDNDMYMRNVDINSCYVIDFASEENRKKYPIMNGRVFVEIRGEKQNEEEDEDVCS